MRKPSSPGPNKRHTLTGLSPLAQLAVGAGFHSRLRLWTVLLVFAFAIIALRLVHIQILCHPYYFAKARSSHLRTWALSARRGEIFDRNGTTLATSPTRKLVYLDPLLLHEETTTPSSLSFFHKKPAKGKQKPKLTTEECIAKLASILQVKPDYIRRKLQETSRYVRLKRQEVDTDFITVPEETSEQIEKLKIPWVGFSNEDKRTYPYGAMAAQTLGFVGKDGRGLAGIEASRNLLLGGKPGKLELEVDGRKRRIPNTGETQTPAIAGQNLTLTLDAPLQQVAELELAKGIKNASAAGGVALVMDPNNGEILALASQPAFDPNDYRKSDPKYYTNPAIVGAYEPGSTFKIVVASATLESGIPESSINIFCSGTKQIGNHIIHCAGHNGHTGAHGQVDLEKMIEKSCNIAAATLGLRLGRETLAKYVKAMGFGKRTGIELSGESPGRLPDPKSWPDIQLANIAFGQGISVTPLQLLRAYSIVANGGRMVKPHLIKQSVAPGPRVISEETARTMRRLFVKVVESGTGKTAGVEDYLIGGKTGTAQKALPGIGYRSGKYIGSFIGFLPADKPKVAILVLIDEPSGSHYGGVVAAPVFREIARQALLRYDVPPGEHPKPEKPEKQTKKKNATHM